MAVVHALVRTSWSGTSGGPGLTQMRFEGITDPHSWDAIAAQSVVNAVRTFWDAIKVQIPDNVTLTVQPTVDVFNNISGELVGSYAAATPPATVAGTSTAVFTMAAGLKLNLNTGVIRYGRRVKGAWFIVPASSASFTTDGVVTAGTVTALNSAGAAMITTLAADNKRPIVYSRPKEAAGGNPARDGAEAPVVSFSTSPKGAILRGRRD